MTNFNEYTYYDEDSGCNIILRFPENGDKNIAYRVANMLLDIHFKNLNLGGVFDEESGLSL